MPMDVAKIAKVRDAHARAAATCIRKALATVDSAAAAEWLRKSVVYQTNVAKIDAEAARRDTGLAKAHALHARRKWKGLDFSVENRKGSVRHWHDPLAGRDGQTMMLHDYGYLRGTEGADGDHVDVYMGPDPDGAAKVYVVRQMAPPQFLTYDEDKCMVGFPSETAARKAYLAHYDDERFLGSVDAYDADDFAAQVGRQPGPVLVKPMSKVGEAAVAMLRRRSP